MPETTQAQNIPLSADLSPIISDLEEKQRLLKERILLIGQTLIKERTETFSVLREMKKSFIKLGEDVIRLKEVVSKISELLDTTAKKEELLILQRQFDLFRKA